MARSPPPKQHSAGTGVATNVANQPCQPCLYSACAPPSCRSSHGKVARPAPNLQALAAAGPGCDVSPLPWLSRRPSVFLPPPLPILLLLLLLHFPHIEPNLLAGRKPPSTDRTVKTNVRDQTKKTGQTPAARNAILRKLASLSQPFRYVLPSCALALSLAGAPGCASRPPSDPTIEVTLDVVDYKEGDRSAMLEVHNTSKHRNLAYDGPYVEEKSATGWTEYKSNEPEMAQLTHPRRVGPSLTDAWWVRVPAGPSHWRAYIRCRWTPKDKTVEPPPEFRAWSAAREAPAVPEH
jgi:hypothetical protein